MKLPVPVINIFSRVEAEAAVAEGQAAWTITKGRSDLSDEVVQSWARGDVSLQHCIVHWEGRCVWGLRLRTETEPKSVCTDEMLDDVRAD